MKVLLFWFALLLALGYGWVMNLISIINNPFTQITGELVVRCVGIFVAPLGSIMGWFF